MTDKIIILENNINKKITNIIGGMGEIIESGKKCDKSNANKLESDTNMVFGILNSLSKSKRVEQFISKTYPFWIDEKGNKNKVYTIKGLLFDHKELYDCIPDKVIDRFWNEFDELIPMMIDYVHLSRYPELNNGVIKYTKSYPSGQHTLSVNKMRKAWI